MQNKCTRSRAKLKLNEIEGYLEAKEKALSQVASHSAQELKNEMLPSF